MSTSFVDSNVFLYVFGADHPLREPCARVLQHIGSGELAATTSTEVVQEVVHVLRRKGRHDLAILVARRLDQLLPDKLPVRAADLRLARDLLEIDATWLYLSLRKTGTDLARAPVAVLTDADTLVEVW